MLNQYSTYIVKQKSNFSLSLNFLINNGLSSEVRYAID